MPGIIVSLASLEDVLEVRGSALNEPELWSILCLCSQRLQHLRFNGDVIRGNSPSVVVTPETLHLGPDGTVTLKSCSPNSFMSSDYCPYEWKIGACELTDSAIEKVWIFSLGMTLYKAADYNCSQHEELNLSHELNAVLADMCEEDSRLRCNLATVMEASENYASRNRSHSFSIHIIKLYETVFGSADNVSLPNSNPSSFSSSPHSINSAGHSIYDIRPVPVGKSEDAPSNFSSKPSQVGASNSVPLLDVTKNTQPNNGAQAHFNASAEDSLKLSHLRSQKTHPLTQNSLPQLHIHPPTPASISYNGLASTAPSGYLRSMPTLNNPSTSHMARFHSVRDTFLENAYDSMMRRRAMLSMIRQSLNNDNVALQQAKMVATQHQYMLDDIKSSANSLHHGSFHPQLQPDPKHLAKNSTLSTNQSYSRPSAVDEIDAMLNDEVIREALERPKSAPPIRPTVSNFPSLKRKLPTRADSVASKKSNKQRLKSGPEFVRKASQPVKKLHDVMSNKGLKTGPRVTVLIELLSGEKLQLFCSPTTTGQQLFEVMLREITLPEHYYFGLTYVIGDEHYFIDHTKRIDKYVPTIKKGLLKKGAYAPFILHQRVKFYIEDIGFFRHTSTQHQLYLQLRRDVIEDRLHADDDDIMRLVGIALQAEYGNYNVSVHHGNYFRLEYYVPVRLLKQAAKWKTILPNKHSENSRLSVEQAETKFIVETQEFHEYGIHFYTVYKNKGDPLSQMWLGITSKGLTLAEKLGKRRTIVKYCSWATISKISFDKERVSIKPHANTDDPTKTTMYTESYKKSKYLVALATDHHKFKVQMAARMESPYFRPVTATYDDELDDDDIDNEIEDSIPEAHYFEGEENETASPVHVKFKEEAGEATSYQYQEPVVMTSDPEETDQDSISRLKVATVTRTVSNNSRRRIVEETDTAQTKSEHHLIHNIEESMSDTLAARFDAIPSDMPERRFAVVKLTRDPQHGLGIRLAGSDSGQISGVFVASINSGGPADREGTMQVGDRLVSINGQAVELLSPSEAMMLLKNTRGDIQLIVSQSMSTHTQSTLDKPATDREMHAVRDALLEEQDDDDIMEQYQQSAAKYHPRQRVAMKQSPLELATQDVNRPNVRLTQRPEDSTALDDISSNDMSSPVDQAPSGVTFIDDISSDSQHSDNENDAALGQKLKDRIRKSPNTKPVYSSSISSSESEAQITRPRQSAFVKVYQNRPSSHSTPNKSANRTNSNASARKDDIQSKSHVISDSSSEQTDVLLRNDADVRKFDDEPKAKVASGDESDISTITPDLDELQNTAKTVEAYQPKTIRKSASKSQTVQQIMAALLDKKNTTTSTPAVNKPTDQTVEDKVLQSSSKYEDSSDEEVSEMMGAKSKTLRAADSPSASTDRGRDSALSIGDQSHANVKLKTPIDDHLEVGDTYEVTLNKVNQSLGLNVTGGVNTSVKLGGIYVKSLVPRGPADMSARIRIGDRVLAVNGFRLTAVTHKQAVETLRNATTPVTISIERGEPPTIRTQSASSLLEGRLSNMSVGLTPTLSTDSLSQREASRDTPLSVSTRSLRAEGPTPDIEKLSFVTPGSCFEVKLTKGSSGLGFSVLGGKDPKSSDPRLSLVRVKKIFPLGAAKKSELNVGDIVLRVNGKSVEGLSHSETVSLLRTAPPQVTLYICRPDPRILSPVSERILNSISDSPVLKLASQNTDTLPPKQTADIEASPVVQSTKSGVLTASLQRPPTPKQDTVDIRSSVSIASTSTLGQDSSTSLESGDTILKSPAVREFEASLKRKVELSHALSTPIRELDDRQMVNTSIHSSRSHSPNLSRGSSLNSSASLIKPSDLPAVNHRLADVGGADGADKDTDQEVEKTAILSSAVSKLINVEREQDKTPRNNIEADLLRRSLRASRDRDNSAVEQRKVQRSESNSSSGTLDLVSPGIIVVTVEKNSYGSLGFSVAGSASLGGCYIKNVISGGASEGLLKAGDKLLEVNGHDITKMSNHAAVELLKSQPNVVVIKIHRPMDTASAPHKPPRDSQTSTPKGEHNSRSMNTTDSFATAVTLSLTNAELANTPSDMLLSSVANSTDTYQENMSGNEISINAETVQVMISSPVIKHLPMVKTTSDTEFDDDDESFTDESDKEEVPDIDSWSDDSEEQFVCQGQQRMGETHINTPAESTGELEAQDTRISTPDDSEDETELDTSSSNEDDGKEDGAAGYMPTYTENVGITCDTLAYIENEKDTHDSPAASEDGERVHETPPADSTGEADAHHAELSTPVYNEDELVKQPMLNDSRISTSSEYSDQEGTTTAEEDSTVSELLNTAQEQRLLSMPANQRSVSTASNNSMSSWGDSQSLSAEDEDKAQKSISSSSPFDLTRNESHKSFDSKNYSLSGLSRNDSLHSRDFSLDSSPTLSRKTSMTLFSDEEVYTVDLKKPDGGTLGFSVNCKVKEGKLQVFIKGVTEGGLADLDSRIKVGDRILKVNGETVVGYTQVRVVTLLRKLEGTVTLLMARQHLQESSPLTDEQLARRLSGGELLTTSSASTPHHPRVFGPSVTTDDDDSEISQDIDPEISHVWTRLDNSLKSAESQDGENTVTDESSFDFDLPDESNYLESSIRLTRNDMKTPQIDNQEDGTDSETTDPLFSREDTYLQTTHRASAADSDTGASLNDDALPAYSDRSWDRKLDSAKQFDQFIPAIPGTTEAELDSGTSDLQKITAVDYEKSDNLAMKNVFGINVTADWVQSLYVVEAPAKGLYTDSSLESIIAQLLAKVANDDPNEEFKQLKSLKPTDNCSVAKLVENRKNNRFRNVLPYDATRVVLNNDEDYINASHIQKAMGKDVYQYIASQGPMPHTTDHFWEMVIQQEVTIIAMVTLDVECGRVKCHRYWPDSLHAPFKAAGSCFEVTLLKLIELEDFDIRHLMVEDIATGKRQKVIHMNYTRWPDHGVPETSLPLLQFIRVMHELHSGGPILVHCSAGIGRTGTLITLDVVLGSIERDLKFDIHQIVTDLRRQRPGMIQTKDQYLFCYTAALEALEILKYQTQQ